MKKFAIHGLPRSGSTWVGELVNSSPNVRYGFQPLFSYAMKGSLDVSSRDQDIERFYRELAVCEDDFVNQTESRISGKLPHFNKGEITHVGYKEVRYHHILPNLIRRAKDVKFVLIQRNPFSVINSWLKAPKEFRGDLGWNSADEWRYAMKKNLNRPEEFNGYEKWKEASLLFHYFSKQFPDNVMLVRYDELLGSTVEHVMKIFEFLSLEYTDQTASFIGGDTKADVDAYSVNRIDQRDDKWLGQLDSGIVEIIKADLRGSVLDVFLPKE